jgi:hypothetical protein
MSGSTRMLHESDPPTKPGDGSATRALPAQALRIGDDEGGAGRGERI